MKIMTFNLRFENDRDGENAWRYRRDIAVDLIRSHAPSILGTQEGTFNQLSYLKEQLPDYAIHVPHGRVLDEKSQYPTLFYRKDRFEALEAGELWLSTTPTVHLSKDWDSAFPRMMSYGLFRDRQTQRHLWVLVTHLDHIGIEARQQQTRIISQWIREKDEPVILMGDFNDKPGSPVHRILISAETGLQDTWQVLNREENEESMTHHGFNGVPERTRMDWIVISRHFQVTDACIVRDHDRSRYPSDHFPYEVELEWVQQP